MERVTWEEIYKDFLKSTGIDESIVVDYRPFSSASRIAIMVWLKTDRQLIYFYPACKEVV